jgi:hypothetical protein
LESKLFDAKNGRYIVCFKPLNQINYRMFGWQEGAIMESVELTLNDTTTSYIVTFSYESIFPLFEVKADNFDLNNKIFIPIWQPLYNISYCVMEGSNRTGYAIAEYVPKITQAGQPLDVNNKLCSISGLKQDAYKYDQISGDGGYNIVGTYNDLGIFDGKPVKVYDETLCPPSASGTISVSPSSINLNTNNNASSFSCISTHRWDLKEEPSLVVVQPNSGNETLNGEIIRGNRGGVNYVLFQNKYTKEIVQVIVNIYLIKCVLNYTFPAGTNSFSIPVVAEGGSNDFSFTTPSGLTIEKDGNILNCTVEPTEAPTEAPTDEPTVNVEQVYDITVIHSSDNTETKTIKVKIR